MRFPRNSKLVQLSRNLRNNATKPERKLWFEFLRTYQPQCYRQKIVGNFILDFFCPKGKLAIEIDGGQHFEDEMVKQDGQRAETLQALGIKTIRFTNFEVVHNFDQVCLAIDEEIKQRLTKV
jgi:very-short-patch-repair endonuclease